MVETIGVDEITQEEGMKEKEKGAKDGRWRNPNHYRKKNRRGGLRSGCQRQKRIRHRNRQAGVGG